MSSLARGQRSACETRSIPRPFMRAHSPIRSGGSASNAKSLSNAWPVPDAMLSSLAACSSIGSAAHYRLKSGLKLGEDRPARHGRSHVKASELGHECLPHSLAAFFKKLGADRELPGRRSEPASPCAHVGQQGDKLNRRFREAVNRLLFVGWVAGAREETGPD